MTQSNPLSMAPGALRGEVRLTLQTRHAQRLLQGRARRADRPGIRGLFGFAERSRVLWRAVQEDDPYADWFLVQIETRLDRSRRSLQGLLQEAVGLAGRSELEWSAGRSCAPVRVQLRFATPYAYRGAHLLADFDRVARTVLTGRFLGVLDAAGAEAMLGRGGRAVRSAFDSVNGYRAFAIDRDAVLQGTPAALRAKAAMGELPAEILAEERVAALRPLRLRERGPDDDLKALTGAEENGGTPPSAAGSDTDDHA